MSHAFGELLRQFCARKRGLSQKRLAHLVGYDQAVLTRMGQGKKDLTGPSGRHRVVQIIAALRDEGVLATQGEANALLKAANMPPLFDGQPAELALLQSLKAEAAQPAHLLTPLSAVHPTSNPHRAVSLPAPLNRFIGRAREMAEIERLLGPGGTRLLTLTGSGGAGKTRLAIEIGAALVDTPAYADGVWLAEFAALAESGLVADAVAAQLDLQVMSRTSLAVLSDFLRDQSALLILDNCEHLIEGTAELAVALLQACPRLHILVTSREPLNVPGEVTWRVPSLPPDEAVELFIERARAVRPDFALTPAHEATVAHICRRLDDMPLALELAAARVRAFSVEQIAARLDDAFRMLTGGSRTALARQQTLRATIDWSYDLLAENERALLRELSVFAGGWTLEAVEAIHGAGAAKLLEQLVNKSLVVAEQRADEKSAGMRYHLLETIRQYAAEKLRNAGEDALAGTRQRHLEYFAGLEQTARLHLSAAGPERKAWRDTLVQEIDNLRAALGWATQCGDWQTGVRLISSVASIWHEPGYAAEICKWIDVLILSNPAASDTARAKGLLMVADAHTNVGDMVGSIEWLRKASVLAHQIEDATLFLEIDANLGILEPDSAQALALLYEVVQYAQRTRRISEIVMAIQFLGTRMGLDGDCHEAAYMLEEGVALARETGQKDAPATLLYRLGQMYFTCADYARARAVLEESAALDFEAGNTQAHQLVELGTIGLYTGDYTLAREALPVTFSFHMDADNMERIAQGLVLAAGLAHVLGKLDEAARLLAAAAAIRRDHHTHGVFERELFAEYDRRLPALRAAMAPSDFERAWAEGQKLTIKEAIAEALAL